MTRGFVRRLAALLGLGLMLGVTGCGAPAKADVSGTVTFQGKAPKFDGIEIVFLGGDGAIASAPLDPTDGSYQATGVTSGEVKVYFVAISGEAAQMGAETKRGGGRLKRPDGVGESNAAPKLAGNYPKTNPIPQHLREPHTSRLTCNVEVGKPNTFNYNIE